MNKFIFRNSIILQTIFTGLNVIFIGIYINILTEKLTNNNDIIDAFMNMGLWNILLIIFILTAWAQIYISVLPNKSISKVKNKIINSILEGAAKSLVYPNSNKHIRAIITIRKGNKRYVEYSYNILGEPERIASYPIEFGITGEAYKTKTVKVQELPSNHIEEYSDDIKQNVLPEIRSILAAPLLSGNKEDEEPLGVLAFDSILEMNKIKFNKSEAKYLAQLWADIISEILINTEN